MSKECVVNDTRSFSTECQSFTNESCDDTEENSPSSAEEQEVNKPLVNSINEQTEFPSLFEELQAANNSSGPTSVESSEGLNDNSLSISNEESNGHITKKPKRNVTFPSDSNIIMGFLEPPNPWKNLPDWRTEDLLRAYYQGCDKHGTKPLNKVVQQLQCIENVGERYEILSLKGERLDLKQIESLEEIFRHVKFRCIDLEATHLDDEMAVAVFEMVEFYESTCKINISFNKSIGPRGWQSCSRLVRNTPCLTFVDARNCDLNERVIPFIGRALRMGCYLSRLHLQNANIAGRALIILVAALKMNEVLKELSIGDNKFMPTDGVHIGNLLKYNHKLELLDLRNNHLQDAGATHIADGLAEQNLDGGLLTLVLWNNQITFHAMRSINKALTSCEYIETLNLGHNPLTNEGIHVLKDGLLKSKSLLKLGLSGTKVTCEGAVALAEVIADNNRLIRVDLQENDIKTAGLMALSLALKVNENLLRLDLDRETKKEAGVKDYVEQQKRLQHDISSILDRNRDLTRQREEEKRQIELKNEENARKLQEAANEVELPQQEEEAIQYIPSGDSVHRPKLLFLPQSSVVQNLDSPAIGSDTFHSSPGNPEHSTLPLSIEGPDLLSPQYCPDPKITAKKIFSVSQVMSPTVPPQMGDYLNRVSCDVYKLTEPSSGVPVPQLCTPLPSLELPNQLSDDVLTPTSIQRVVEQQTLESYIQDIIGQSDDNSEAGELTSDGNVSSVDKISVHSTSNSGPDHTETTMNVMKHEGDIDKDSQETVKSPQGQIDASDNDKSIVEANMESFEVEDPKFSVSGQCNDEHTLPGDVVNSIEIISGELDNNVNEAMLSNEIDVNSCNAIDVKEVENIQICDTNTSNIPEQGGNESPEVDEASNGCNANVNDNASSCDTETTPHSVKEIQHASSESLNINTCNSQLDVLEPSSCDSQSETIVGDPNSRVVKENDAFTNVLNSNKDCEMNSLSFETVEKGDENSSKNIQKLGDSAIQDEIPNTVGNQKDSDARSLADLESWNAISQTEVSENDSLVVVSPPNDISNTNKPDFFSSLSMNGLKQELASLIDDEGNHSVSSSLSGTLVNGSHASQQSNDVDKMTDTGS